MPPARRVRRPAGAGTVATTPAPPRRPTAITSLQDAEAPRYRKWCVYGESDVGKTVLAGTAPKALFLRIDIEGTESAKARGSLADEIFVPDFTTFCSYVDWIVRGSGKEEYEWIIPDTITELEQMCWEEQLVSADLKRASKYQPNKGDYPVVWSKVMEQLKLLGRAPVNVLYVAHVMRVDRETEEGEDTVTCAMPALGSRKRGDTSMQFCSQLGMVGYMRKVSTDEAGNQERQLMTASTSRWVARDRSDTLGMGMAEPTVPALLAKMNRDAVVVAPTAARRTRRRAS